MKNKVTQIGVCVIGVAAAAVRVAEKCLTIGEDGYYLSTPLAQILKWVLIALLAAGTLWSIFGFGGDKEEATAEMLSYKTWTYRLDFTFLAVISAMDGILRFFEASSSLEKAGAVLLALGALGWAAFAWFPQKMGLLAVLPTLQFSAQIIFCFWSTYKEIHVSTYILAMLGWCVGLYLVQSLGKVLAGASCTKGRLRMACGLTAVFLFTSHVLDGTNAFNYSYGIFLVVLAGNILRDLAKTPETPAPAEGPDLSAMNEYMESIPEVEEE